MPLFKIEDNHSGFKLLVEGDQAPTEKDADSLVKEELSFLSTNIFHGGGNRFVLDVGPLSDVRTDSDKFSDILKNPDVNVSENVFQKARGRVESLISNMKSRGLIKNSDDELAVLKKRYPELIKEESQAVADKRPPGATESIMNNLPENSLMLLSHGSKSGGLENNDGTRFTLHNLATVLGESTNSIGNIYNLSCYGGMCKPEDFREHFPNVTNVVQTPSNVPNVLSVDRLSKGQFYGEGITPITWRRIGDVWKDQSAPQTNQSLMNIQSDTNTAQPAAVPQGFIP